MFSVTKDDFDNSYYVGNQDSNFFIGKRDKSCAMEWTSTDGSTIGDNDNDENSEILYSVIVGIDGLLYATGSTRGNFTSPLDEVPNLDAAVVVYDPSSGRTLRQRQYDVVSGFDNVGRAIVQKPDGMLLVAVYGSPPNVDNSAVYQTLLMEINQVTLDIENLYSLTVTTTEIFPVFGGPKILDFLYDTASSSIVAVGHILGRGILWRYSLVSGVVTAQAEWGTIFGSYQISGFTTDGDGAFYVVGSSQERVLGNTDVSITVSSQFHAYVIRYDSLIDAQTPATWVRQLDAAGGSQSGMDIAIDPVTSELVVIGTFDADFEVTDSKTSLSFQVKAVTDNGLTDVYIWALEPEGGNFSDVRKSTLASTVSEDRANTVQVMSDRRVDIGGVINDGIDENPLICDESEVVSFSPSAPISPSPSTTLISSPGALPLPSNSVTTSPSASVTPSPGIRQSSSASSIPSPSGMSPMTTSPTISTSQPFGSVPIESGITSAVVSSSFSQFPSITPQSTISTISETPVASALPIVTSFSTPSMSTTPIPAATQTFGIPTSPTVSELRPVASTLVSSSSAVQSGPSPFAPTFNTSPGIPQEEDSSLELPYSSEEFVLTLPTTIVSAEPFLQESNSPTVFSARPSAEYSKAYLLESLLPSLFVVPSPAQFAMSPSGLISSEVSPIPPILTMLSPSFVFEASSGLDGTRMSPGILFETALPSREIGFSPEKDVYSLAPSAQESLLFPSQVVFFTESPLKNFSGSPGLSPGLEDVSEGLGLGSPEASPKVSLLPSPEMSLESNNQAAPSSTKALASKPHHRDDIEPSHSSIVDSEEAEDNLLKTFPSIEASATADVLSGSSEADFDMAQKPTLNAESTDPLEEIITIGPLFTPEDRPTAFPEIDLVHSQPPEPSKESANTPVTVVPEEELPASEVSTSESPGLESHEYQVPRPSDSIFPKDPNSEESRPVTGYAESESPRVDSEPSKLPKLNGDLTHEDINSPAASSFDELIDVSESSPSRSAEIEPRPLPRDVPGKPPSIDLMPSQSPESSNEGDLVTKVPSEESTHLPFISAIWSAEIGSDIIEKPNASDFATQFPSEATSLGPEVILEGKPSGFPDFDLIPSQLPKPNADGYNLATMAPSKEAMSSPEESIQGLSDINFEVSQKLEPSNSDTDLPKETTAREPTLTPGREPRISSEFSVEPFTSPEPSFRDGDILAENPVVESSPVLEGAPKESSEIYSEVPPLASLNEGPSPTTEASKEPGFLISGKPNESPQADAEALQSALPGGKVTSSPSRTYLGPNPSPEGGPGGSSHFDLTESEQPLPSVVITSPVFPLSTLSATPSVSDSLGKEILPSLLPSSEFLEASLQPLEQISMDPFLLPSSQFIEASIRPLEQISVEPSPLPSPRFIEPSLQSLEEIPAEPSPLPSSRFVESSPQPPEQTLPKPSPQITMPELGIFNPSFEESASPSKNVHPSEDDSSLVSGNSPVPSSVDSYGLSPTLQSYGTFEPSPAFSREIPPFLVEVSYLPLPPLETSQVPSSQESQEPDVTFAESVLPIIGPSFPYVTGISTGPSSDVLPFIVEMSMQPSPIMEVEDVPDPSPKPAHEQILPSSLIGDASPERTKEDIPYGSVIPMDDALFQSPSEENNSPNFPVPHSSSGKLVIGTPEATVSVESNFATIEPIESATILPSAAVSLISSQTPMATRGKDFIPSASPEVSVPAVTAPTLASPDNIILPTNFSQTPWSVPRASVLPSSVASMAPFVSPMEAFISPFSSPFPSSEEQEPIVTRSPSLSPSVSEVADIVLSPLPSTSVTPSSSSPSVILPSILINSWTPTPSQSGNRSVSSLQPSLITPSSPIVSISPSASPPLLQSPSPLLVPSWSTSPSARVTMSITISTSPSSSPSISAFLEASLPAIQSPNSQLPPFSSLEPLLPAYVSPSITNTFTSLSGVEGLPISITAPATVETSYTPIIAPIDIPLQPIPSAAMTPPEVSTSLSPVAVETPYTPFTTLPDVSLRITPSTFVTTSGATVSAAAPASPSSDPFALLSSPSLSVLSPVPSRSSSSSSSPSLSPSSERTPDNTLSLLLSTTTTLPVTPSTGSSTVTTPQLSANSSVSAFSSLPSPETTPDTVISPSTLPRPPPAPATPSLLEIFTQEPPLLPSSPSAGTGVPTLLPSKSADASKLFSTEPTEEPINPPNGSARPIVSTPRSPSPLLSPIASSIIAVNSTAVDTPEYETPKGLEISEAPEASRTNEKLEVPEALETNETLEVPEASETLETFQTPQASGVLEIFKVPEASEVMEPFGASETLKVSESPASTKTPEDSQLPVSSNPPLPPRTREPYDTPGTSLSPDSSLDSAASILPLPLSISPSVPVLPSFSSSSSPSNSPPRSIPPSFIGPIASSSPSSSSLPVSTSTLMVSPATVASSLNPMMSINPMMTPNVSPLVVPSFSCNETDFVHDVSELLPTENFQRVQMIIQVAGPNVTNSCGLTNEFVERFVNLSAINTQSNAALWFITLVEDGPAVYSGSSSASLITIEIDDIPVVNDTPIASPTPSNSQGNRQLFSGSVVFHVTAYLEPLSVGLAQGSYVEYIDSQNIVRRMKELMYDDIAWTGMIEAPKVLDARTDEESIPQRSGISVGTVGAIGAIAIMVAGAAILIFKDGSIVTSTVSARPPLADMV